MRIAIFVAAALLGACTVGVEQEQPIDAFAQPKEAQEPAQKELSREPGSAQVAVAKAASAEEIEKMHAARREARAAVKRRALQTDLPELLAKIKATPEGPERRRLMGDYVTAAHYADAEIAVKAMRELDELVATH
ncbi:MAG TPA: hypothetical protein VL242_07440 [Sorangium sp.]|nr:hypothetical protein [Sorangium sp.]